MLDVEQVPCKKRGNTGRSHVLTNDEEGRTKCKFCTTSWASLDKDLRSKLPPKEVPS